MAVSKKRALPREKPETVRREFWVEIHRRAMLGVPKTSGLAADTPSRYQGHTEPSFTLSTKPERIAPCPSFKLFQANR